MVDQRPEAGSHSSGGISEPEAKSLCTWVYVKNWNMCIFALGGDNQRSTRGFYEKTDKVGTPASNISHVVSEVIGDGGTSVGERRDVHAIDGLCPSNKGVVIWRVGAPVQSWWRRIPPLHVEFENGGSSTIVTRNGCEVLWCALQYGHWSKNLARPQARMNWAGASNSILSIRHGYNVL